MQRLSSETLRWPCRAPSSPHPAPLALGHPPLLPDPALGAIPGSAAPAPLSLPVPSQAPEYELPFAPSVALLCWSSDARLLSVPSQEELQTRLHSPGWVRLAGERGMRGTSCGHVSLYCRGSHCLSPGRTWVRGRGFCLRQTVVLLVSNGFGVV